MNKERGILSKTISVICSVLCIILACIAVCNLLMFAKSIKNPDEVPSAFGYTPLAVRSGSMSGTAEDHIEIGDLIIIKKVGTDTLKEGDVIAFQKDSSIVTHRIVEVQTDENGERTFITKGDANNTQDEDPVLKDEVVGICIKRVPKIGEAVLFLGTAKGMILCLGVPLAIYIVLDMLHQRKRIDEERQRRDELERELMKVKKTDDASQ